MQVKCNFNPWVKLENVLNDTDTLCVNHKLTLTV